MELYLYINDSTTQVSFWRRGSRILRKMPNAFGDSIIFHMRNTIQKIDSLYATEITEYRDTSKTLISQSYGEYAKYSITRELLTNNVKTEYFYDTNGQIYKSEWFGYDEYGNRISRAVAGIDGTPVRCPNWDWDDLCFYKMSVLYPFNNKDRSVFVSALGLNEFNESSYITRISLGELSRLSISELPYRYIYKHEDGVNKTGVAIAKTESRISSFQYYAFFVHVLSKEGSFYKSGLKDGDIIISVNNNVLTAAKGNNIKQTIVQNIQKIGGEVTVARADVNNNKYTTYNYIVPPGNACAEIHLIELTEQENKRLQLR